MLAFDRHQRPTFSEIAKFIADREDAVQEDVLTSVQAFMGTS